MPSQFLRSTRTPLALGGLAFAGPVGGAPAPNGPVLLGFRMQPQVHSNWCWAATGVSTDRYYRPASALTQCSVANLVTGSTSCCQSPGPCNQQRSLNLVLARLNCLAPNGFITGRLTFAQLRTRLVAGRPVAVRIEWSGGGGHFVVLDGVEVAGGVQYVTVRDPASGTTRVAYSTFCTAYRGSGTWTHSYLTQ
ncbi:MAG: papain-like cysteine protease family protein [Planctomycetaceae bacterium]